MFDVFQFYDKGEIVQELDMSDYQCSAIQGKDSMNEACGGCVGCLLEQALYHGGWHDFDNSIIDGKNVIKMTYIKDVL